MNNDQVEGCLGMLRHAAEQGRGDPAAEKKYLERLEELLQTLESGVATFEPMRKSCASLRPDGDLVTKNCPNLPLDLAQDLTDPSGCKCNIFAGSMCSVSLRESAYPVMLNAQRMRTSIQGELDTLRGASSASTTAST
jgi:hypothetical protein